MFRYKLILGNNPEKYRVTLDEERYELFNNDNLLLDDAKNVFSFLSLLLYFIENGKNIPDKIKSISYESYRDYIEQNYMPDDCETIINKANIEAIRDFDRLIAEYNSIDWNDLKSTKQEIIRILDNFKRLYAKN